MKKLFFFLLIGLISFVVSLVVQAPLNVVLNYVKPQGISLGQTQGTLFNGEVSQVRAPRAPVIERFTWEFSPKFLLQGKAMLQWEASIKDGQASGTCGVSFDQSIYCSTLTANIALSTLQPYLPPIRVQGTEVGIQGDVFAELEQVQWKKGSLPQLSGTVEWITPELTQPIPMPLGEILSATIQSSDELLTAELDHHETVLGIKGSALTLAQDGQYDANILVTKTDKTPAMIGNNLEIALGKANNQGEYEKTLNGTLILPNWLAHP